ncbi:MAG: hypothetical protein Q9227_005566 [Pyrenula ochraceoflavens]
MYGGMRFLVYKGSKSIILSKLVTEPSHSILTQSYDSRLRIDKRRPVNGDGFGVGWYTDAHLGPEPCIFTSTLPAWNCVNLERLAPKTCSPLIFAHVRATTDGALAESNCHPFQHETLMWMHNGNIGSWKYVKRPLAASLADKWYVGVKGGIDSEWAFALFLDLLEKEGVNPSSSPQAGFSPKLLRRAMKKTIAKINEFVKAVPAEHNLAGAETRSLLNFAVTDGHTVVVTRYVSSKTDEAASLYWSSGTDWMEGPMRGQFKMERRDKASDVVLVASEPLTFDQIHNQIVSIKEIKDEFFDVRAQRSLEFAQSKGLVTKGPGGEITTPSRSEMPSREPTPFLAGGDSEQ